MSTDIEIVGVWLPNKGAELMAHAAISELRQRLDDVSFHCVRQGPDAARTAIGMQPFDLKPKTVGKRILAKLGMIPASNRPAITHVLDLSGFAYGDHWGVNKARNRAGHFLREGAPVYFSPQAFGPFSSDAFQKEMRYIVNGSRIISARDAVSADHLRALGCDREIAVVPDITLGLDVSDRAPKLPDGPYACLVLNAKLVSSGKMTQEEVLSLYQAAIRLIKNAGITPVITLHEPVADRDISEKLAERENADIVSFDDARDTKHFISRSRCVITARFHGLANALSTGVPAFAVSWSHKYRELLRDFGCGEAVFEGEIDGFLEQVKTILDNDSAHRAHSEKLAAHVAEIKPHLARYWDQIAADMTRKV